jgi:sulfate transport system substrate-binding protein
MNPSDTLFTTSNQHKPNPLAWRSQLSWAIIAVVVVLAALYLLNGFIKAANAPVNLIVYAFSTQEEVFSQGIFPKFTQTWEAETGQQLTIEAVYGPSGTIAGQINLGAPADIAIFSNKQHVNWLKLGRMVHEQTRPVEFGYTPMVIVTRPGNPASINEYSDLSQEGLRLLHADPRSSGAGEWAVLAEYGSAYLQSGDTSIAEIQLKDIWRNVRLLGPSARSTLSLFELGAADALVTYEQDARLALERGVQLEILIPTRTIMAQHVVVIVDNNVTTKERAASEALISYLLSDDGQQILSRYHLRPIHLINDSFPPLDQPFLVEDLGGWSKAHNTLIEGIWKSAIEPHLNLSPMLLEIGDQ